MFPKGQKPQRREASEKVRIKKGSKEPKPIYRMWILGHKAVL